MVGSWYLYSGPAPWLRVDITNPPLLLMGGYFPIYSGLSLLTCYSTCAIEWKSQQPTLSMCICNVQARQLHNFCPIFQRVMLSFGITLFSKRNATFWKLHFLGGGGVWVFFSRSLPRPFNKISKILCQGQWPRGITKKGQIKVVFLLKERVKTKKNYEHDEPQDVDSASSLRRFHSERILPLLICIIIWRNSTNVPSNFYITGAIYTQSWQL